MLPPDLLTQTALLHAAYGAAAGVLLTGGLYLWRDRDYLSWRWRNRNEPLPADYVPDDSTYSSDPPPDDEERRKLHPDLAKSGAIFAVMAVAFLDGADWLFPAAMALFGVPAAVKILFGDGAGVMEVGADPDGFKPRQTLRQRLRLAASELAAVAAAAFGWLTNLRSRDDAGPATQAEFEWMKFADSDCFFIAIGLVVMAVSVLTFVNIATSESSESEGSWSTLDEHPKLGEGIAASVLFLGGVVTVLATAF